MYSYPLRPTGIMLTVKNCRIVDPKSINPRGRFRAINHIKWKDKEFPMVKEPQKHVKHPEPYEVNIEGCVHSWQYKGRE
jgi:hypothetical protein